MTQQKSLALLEDELGLINKVQQEKARIALGVSNQKVAIANPYTLKSGYYYYQLELGQPSAVSDSLGENIFFKIAGGVINDKSKVFKFNFTAVAASNSYTDIRQSS